MLQPSGDDCPRADAPRDPSKQRERDDAAWGWLSTAPATPPRNVVAVERQALPLAELVEHLLAAAAHEVRTPLAIVRAHAQLMERRHATDHEEAASITRQVDRLTHLLQQLIELSRLRFGRAPVPLEVVDLASVVERAVSRTRRTAPRHDVRVASDVAARPKVRGDVERIEHAVAHLLDNAVRFSPAGGIVEATVRSTPAHAVVAIRDEGIGIPRDLQARVFDPMSEAHRATRATYGGLGVGLGVCRHIVGSHGGTIRLESAPGEGSTFTVSLPLASDVSTSVQPRSVLVVEDDRDLLALLALLLSTSGYRIRTAANGEEALSRVAEELPGLILLDMQMPRMNGWEFARELRVRHGRPCPIVVMTAAESARVRAQEIDAEAWLPKPFDVDEVLELVARYVGPAAADAPAHP